MQELIFGLKVIWMLYRGDMTATLGVPDVPQADEILRRTREGAPFEETLEVAQDLARDWVVIVSIPRVLSQADEAAARVRSVGATELTRDEGQVLKDLGMELPLGEWADMNESWLLRLGGGPEC